MLSLHAIIPLSGVEFLSDIHVLLIVSFDSDKYEPLRAKRLLHT